MEITKTMITSPDNHEKQHWRHPYSFCSDAYWSEGSSPVVATIWNGTECSHSPLSVIQECGRNAILSHIFSYTDCVVEACSCCKDSRAVAYCFQRNQRMVVDPSKPINDDDVLPGEIPESILLNSFQNNSQMLCQVQHVSSTGCGGSGGIGYVVSSICQYGPNYVFLDSKGFYSGCLNFLWDEKGHEYDVKLENGNLLRFGYKRWRDESEKTYYFGGIDFKFLNEEDASKVYNLVVEVKPPYIQSDSVREFTSSVEYMWSS